MKSMLIRSDINSGQYRYAVSKCGYYPMQLHISGLKYSSTQCNIYAIHGAIFNTIFPPCRSELKLIILLQLTKNKVPLEVETAVMDWFLKFLLQVPCTIVPQSHAPKSPRKVKIYALWNNCP